MVVQQSDGDACCATVAAVITVPLDPELPDPELPDPELLDPELLDPELPDPELPDPELLDPELPEADELAELVARVPIR